MKSASDLCFQIEKRSVEQTCAVLHDRIAKISRNNIHCVFRYFFLVYFKVTTTRSEDEEWKKESPFSTGYKRNKKRMWFLFFPFLFLAEVFKKHILIQEHVIYRRHSVHYAILKSGILVDHQLEGIDKILLKIEK